MTLWAEAEASRAAPSLLDAQRFVVHMSSIVNGGSFSLTYDGYGTR